MKKLLSTLLVFALFLGLGCSDGGNLDQANSPQFTLNLNLGKKLKKEDLIAELGIYQKEDLKLIKGLSVLALKEVGGKLIVDIREEVNRGDYILRIYLTHKSSQKLIWVGEWEISGKQGGKVGMPKQNKVIKDQKSAQGQLKGDKHPLNQKAKNQGKSAFESEGKNNIDQVCSAGVKSCDGQKPRICNLNGFG